jgi:hypothetical protein
MARITLPNIATDFFFINHKAWIDLKEHAEAVLQFNSMEY